MDGFDRVLAVAATFMAIAVIAIVITVLAASFIAHPVETVVIIVAIIWLFRRIYPHIVRLMEKENS